MRTSKQILHFHIQAKDYFATLATVLTLLKERIKEKNSDSENMCDEVLDTIKQDLLYLQEHYTIQKKPIAYKPDGVPTTKDPA